MGIILEELESGVASWAEIGLQTWTWDHTFQARKFDNHWPIAKLREALKISSSRATSGSLSFPPYSEMFEYTILLQVSL